MTISPLTKRFTLMPPVTRTELVRSLEERILLLLECQHSESARKTMAETVANTVRLADRGHAHRATSFPHRPRGHSTFCLPGDLKCQRQWRKS